MADQYVYDLLETMSDYLMKIERRVERLECSEFLVGADMAVLPIAVSVSTDDIHEPASNTTAVITYSAVASIQHIISDVFFSYSDDPTGGGLTIEDGANTIFSIGIAHGGAGFIPLIPPKKGTANTNLVITLAAGGAGITGKLSVTHWTV